MIDPAAALSALPAGLRDPLVAEYRSVVRNYAERRWSPAELSGGRFCEVVYTVLDGHSRSAFPAVPAKPPNFPAACKALEAHTHVPRSFQILIPRALPALYEVRNNRGVGHVGGDVDPNPMDAGLVVAVVGWVMAELVRVFHNLDTPAAQAVVDALAGRRTPLVWFGDEVRRVLVPDLPLRDTLLLLLSTEAARVPVADLLLWCGSKDRGYVARLLRQLHVKRLVELSAAETRVQLLPPGSAAVSELVARLRPA